MRLCQLFCYNQSNMNFMWRKFIVICEVIGLVITESLYFLLCFYETIVVPQLYNFSHYRKWTCQKWWKDGLMKIHGRFPELKPKNIIVCILQKAKFITIVYFDFFFSFIYFIFIILIHLFFITIINIFVVLHLTCKCVIMHTYLCTAFLFRVKRSWKFRTYWQEALKNRTIQSSVCTQVTE